jgi:hypothetical protein
MGVSEIFQFMPSEEKPAYMFIWTALLSQRNTPAYPSPKGTTAELNMEFETAVS